MNRRFLKYKFIVLIALLLGVGGCSIKTVYHRMDWVLAALVEDYIQLSEEQDQYVEQRIADMMQWHRTTQLPLYVTDLLQVKKDTDAGLHFDKIKAFYELLNQRWIALKDRTAPEIAGLLSTLNKDQQNRMFAAIKDKNVEYVKEYINITQEQRNEIIGERLIENFERWLGPLSDTQKAVFRQWLKKFKPVHQDRLEFRRAWQKELRLVLNSSLPEQEKRKELTELFRNPEKYQSPVYKDKLAYNREQSIYLILATPITPEQKQHLFAQIDYYVRNLQELAREKSD